MTADAVENNAGTTDEAAAEAVEILLGIARDESVDDGDRVDAASQVLLYRAMRQ